MNWGGILTFLLLCGVACLGGLALALLYYGLNYPKEK